MKPTKIVSFVFALVALAAPAFGQSNKSLILDPSACQATAATTAVTNVLVRAAAGNLVFQSTTNTTAGTVTLTCDISVALRLGGIGKINSVNIFYGVQTTALSSVAAASFQRVTYANSTAAGAAAAGTVSSALGGTLTVTPTALQLTTTTTGQCFNQMVRFGTPITPNGNSKITYEQVFTVAGTSATVLQVCAIQVNYTEPPTQSSVN